MGLSPKAQDVLRMVAVFGGYASGNIIKQFFGVSSTFANRMLVELSDQKYLKLIINYPKIYQITHRGCVFISRPNSYLRRKHTTFAIRKKLMTAYFLGQNFSPATFENILGFSDTRIEYLRKQGVDDSSIPYKLNGENKILQVEEYIISLPPFAPKGGFCVVHSDMLESAISTQLRSTVGLYVPIMRSGLPISFVAVTESMPRARRYDIEYRKIISRELLKPDFHIFPISYSFDFVLKKLDANGV